MKFLVLISLGVGCPADARDLLWLAAGVDTEKSCREAGSAVDFDAMTVRWEEVWPRWWLGRWSIGPVAPDPDLRLCIRSWVVPPPRFESQVSALKELCAGLSRPSCKDGLEHRLGRG